LKLPCFTLISNVLLWSAGTIFPGKISCDCCISCHQSFLFWMSIFPMNQRWHIWANILPVVFFDNIEEKQYHLSYATSFTFSLKFILIK
jgi:hypothetical protein